MDPRKILKQQFLDTVENQLREDNPPETAQTLSRLKGEGYSEQEAKELIGTCVAAEIYSIMKFNETFNKERYVGWLHQLPDLPE